MNVEVFGDSVEQTDVDAIVQFVADLQHSQQNELPDAFMDLFSKNDPVWTTGGGTRLSGWNEISEFTHKVLPGAMKESMATYEVARILFIRPDVAAVNVHQRPIHLDGRILEGAPEGRPFYILRKDDGAWKIAAAQNTQVHS
jgi:uncharacterized protein (TIGR02246 family)